MSLSDSLKKALSPELFTQVIDALGDDFDMDLVPRTRLNTVIKQRNDLRKAQQGQVDPQNADDEADTADTSTAAKSPAPPVNLEALKKQYESQQAEAIRGVQIQYAALEKLRGAKAVDADLIWKAGLLDTQSVQVGADGQVTGLDEAIASLQTSKAHLFGVVQKDSQAQQGTGKSAGGDPPAVVDKAAFLKMPVEQQLAFKQDHPTLFQEILKG